MTRLDPMNKIRGRRGHCTSQPGHDTQAPSSRLRERQERTDGMSVAAWPMPDGALGFRDHDPRRGRS